MSKPDLEKSDLEKPDLEHPNPSLARNSLTNPSKCYRAVIRNIGE